MRNKTASILIIPILVLVCCLQSSAQDYIGAGNSEGIIVTASSTEGNSSPENTINGKGMDADLFEASRFLFQAAFGGKKAEVETLAETLDFEAWIDNQIALTPTTVTEQLEDIWAELYQLYIDNGIAEEDIYGPNHIPFNYSWWQNLMDKEDQLRMKLAYMLSELLVVSADNSDIYQYGDGLADFYDIFMNHAFGNYKDILMEVSLHPLMGFYLSHLDNPKAIPEENIFPDENYAREILQLFSIGLYELNMDGSRKLDSNGEEIPTYTNDHIKELAKVFTGLGAGAVDEQAQEYETEPYFGMGFWGADKVTPMAMYEDFHEPGEKSLLGVETIPAGQSGMQDIEDAIDFIFNHDNVGPFLARRFIQRLVKSNPSPEYIERVALTFNDNGAGERGDMAAVVKAILLDTEARDCIPMLQDFSGRLRAPTTKYTHIAKSLDLDSPLGRYWNQGYAYWLSTWHLPMHAPSVFNFYLPDHAPNNTFIDNNIVAPEFQIHNTQIATSYINQVADWTLYNNFMYSWEQDDPVVNIITDPLESLAEETEKLLNELDILFTHGQLSDETRGYLRDAIEPLHASNGYNNLDRVKMILSLFFISADYNIMR